MTPATRPLPYVLMDWIDETAPSRVVFWIACCVLGAAWGVVWGRVSIWVMP